MTIPEIIAALKRCDGKFQREAIEEAIAQREAIIPELLRILEEDTANLAEIAQDEKYQGHIYAMHLLAQFREPRAYPLLVNLLTKPSKLVDMALGELVDEGLNQVLASVCLGDTSSLKRIIEDSTINEYARSSAQEAMVILVAQGVKSRDEVMAYFKELFHSKLEREFSVVWLTLVSQCCLLYPDEVMPEIEQVFADNLIEEFYIDLDYIKNELAAGKEHALTRLANDPKQRFIEDTIREMEWWCCYQEPVVRDVQPSPASLPVPSPEEAIFNTPNRRTMPKVGRNEPCPCGSGKKYKRCCGA